MSEAVDAGLPGRLERLERLIREMEAGPESPVRARARALVRAVLELHAGALRRMLDAVATDGARPALLEAFARDPEVAGVLLLHGLHPLDLESRVRAALDALAPALRGQGARVGTVGVAAAAVRIRLEREPGSAGPPAAALRARVEEAIVAAAPDASTIDVEVPEAPAAFVPLEQVRLRARTPAARAR